METIHNATVAATEWLGPRMVRVRLRLEGTGEGAWATTGRADEFVHVEVGADTADADGHSSRHYTVSGLTPDGFEMEIFLHGDGPGATWARTASVGDTTQVSDAKGYYAPPAGSGVRVLVGDLTALPAIARILAEAAATETFHVVIEATHESDRRDLPTAAQAHVEWVVGGNGHGASVLKDALVRLAASGSLLGADQGTYVWVACESVHSRQIRQYLRRDLALPLSHYRIVGYWHADLDRAMRVWNAASEDQRAAYAALWREDRSDEENWLELEPFLQELGV